MMNAQVYENPMWENARKALEAVSPKKGQSNQPEQMENGNMGPNNRNMSPQEMYYQQLNNFKQSQGNGMPQRPPFFGMPPNNTPPGFGMSPQQQQFGRGGRFRGPRPPFGPDQSMEPPGFNQQFMHPRPQHFQPRNNMQQHPGAGGVRFSIPKRNKMQQQQQNGDMNHYQGPPPNFNKNPRFMGPRGPRPPIMNNNNASNGNTPEKSNRDSHSPANDQKVSGEAQMADWPPTLKNWVQRAFASVKNKEQKDQMESILKNKLTDAFTSGAAFSTDWEKEALPFDHPLGDVPGPKKRSRWEPSAGGGPMSPQGVNGHMNMRGQRGGFMRGRGGPSPRARGRMPRSISRNSRSYSRSRSRSYSRSSRSWSRSRSRSRSRSPERRRRRLTSPSRRSPGRSRRRYRSRSRSRSRSSSRSSRSSRDFYSLEVKQQRGRGRGARSRGRGKDGGSRGRGRGRMNKNKKNFMDEDGSPPFGKGSPPFGKKNEKGKNQKNNKSPKGKGKVGGAFKLENTEESAEKLLKRAARFGNQLNHNKPKNRLSLSVTPILVQDSDEESNMDWGSYHITGTCQELEKQYFRISGPPDASKIRPVEVLAKSLEMVKIHWSKNMDYHYACEQMKTIRQDLTVQGVRDEFTVRVYETHARIAMERGDHEEFNQCQTQLKTLYSQDLPGNKLEFTAYRILYYIYTSNLGDLNLALTDLTMEDRKDECVKHALLVRSAWALTNHHKFFNLYLNAPKMSGYLMDKFVGRIRKAALKSAIKAYRPSLPIDHIVPELGFSDRDECIEFLNEMKVTLTADKSKLDCKASMAVVNSI